MRSCLFIAQEDEWLAGAIDDSHGGVEPFALALSKCRFRNRSRKDERQIALHHDALRVRVKAGHAKEPERDPCSRPCHIAPHHIRKTSLSTVSYTHLRAHE